jgi:hypothetical protein
MVIALFIIRHKVHGWILIIMRIFSASRIGRKPARKGGGAEASGFMRRISSHIEKSAFRGKIILPKGVFHLYYFQIRMRQDAPRIFHSG